MSCCCAHIVSFTNPMPQCGTISHITFHGSDPVTVRGLVHQGGPNQDFPPFLRPMPIRPPFFIREIYKNGFLKRLPYNERKSSALAKLMKSDRFWVVFSVHDDVHPFLELWHEPTEVTSIIIIIIIIIIVVVVIIKIIIIRWRASRLSTFSHFSRVFTSPQRSSLPITSGALSSTLTRQQLGISLFFEIIWLIS